uniref:Uncharacterized protein n=1 Tax=Bursaphelenchus xylophilus TaxID=6326 RepID=A0A1I7SKS9_BURXY
MGETVYVDDEIHTEDKVKKRKAKKSGKVQKASSIPTNDSALAVRAAVPLVPTTDESEKPESEKMFNIWELVLYPVSKNYFEDRELKFRIP